MPRHFALSYPVGSSARNLTIRPNTVRSRRPQTPTNAPDSALPREKKLAAALIFIYPIPPIAHFFLNREQELSGSNVNKGEEHEKAKFRYR
jgi:hypothetical protein